MDPPPPAVQFSSVVDEVEKRTTRVLSPIALEPTTTDSPPKCTVSHSHSQPSLAATFSSSRDVPRTHNISLEEETLDGLGRTRPD